MPVHGIALLLTATADPAFGHCSVNMSRKPQQCSSCDFRNVLSSALAVVPCYRFSRPFFWERQLACSGRRMVRLVWSFVSFVGNCVSLI